MTPVAVPRARPKLALDAAITCLRAVPTDVTRPVLLGVRGYYRDTMGVPGVNDAGVYDDAVFLVTPERLLAFNANTDPSRSRPGMATLKPGVWLYRVGTHNLSKDVARQYEALVQAASVTVQRAPAAEGLKPRDHAGWFGINIHKGGIESTSSEGCQTIVPSQWIEFIGAVKASLKAANRTVIEYVLIEGGSL